MAAGRHPRPRASRRGWTYRDAGVSIDANTAWVDHIRRMMRSTYSPRVFSRHNAFAGLFRLDYDEQLFRRNYTKPLLVACADGVGTKTLLATRAGDLSTVGIDLVAMNVNDLVTTGAEPLFFLDYIATGAIKPASLAPIMSGMVTGCRQAGCTLLGGETAEMPDLYKPGHLDLAGFAVGVVELHRAVDPARVQPGDLLIGLSSSGVHSNGFTLVRHIVAARRANLRACPSGWSEPLGATLLKPTRIYVKSILSALAAYRVKRPVTAMAHITGGGLAENIARVLPRRCRAVVTTSAWTSPPVFDWIQSGGVDRSEMFRVFNMGIGFVLIVRPTFADSLCRRLTRAGETPTIIGEIKRGHRAVRLQS